MPTVQSLAADLAAGRTTSRALVEQSLARIADPAGEGARAFLKVYAESARADADHSDRLRKAGVVRSPVDGLPISVKDLYDVAGDVTRAGSKIFNGNPPARNDAPAVARLRAAGAIMVGRTNMVEFAFGGTGLNPHYGTPKNPWDRKTGRVPGGSSSGAGVATADEMCVMGLGSDTRGSVRMPAALCGIVGFKPTARRIPTEGAFPLSYSLDSVGPLARSVDCCATYDAILAGEPVRPLSDLVAKGLRLLVPRSSVFDTVDAHVGASFEAALASLARAGASITEMRVPALDRQGEYFKGGGYSGAEAAHIHLPWAHRLGEYDRRVGQRITLGKSLSVTDYIEFSHMRTTFQREIGSLIEPYDAMLMPCVPCVAPSIAEVDASDEAYMAWNLKIVSICGLINFLDGCASTVPCQAPGTGPVGMMVCGTAMTDRHTLAVSRAIETVVSNRK